MTVKYVGDSHYELGFTTGATAKANIASRFSQSSDLAALLQWYQQDGSKEVRFVAFRGAVMKLRQRKSFADLRVVRRAESEAVPGVLRGAGGSRRWC